MNVSRRFFESLDRRPLHGLQVLRQRMQRLVGDDSRPTAAGILVPHEVVPHPRRNAALCSPATWDTPGNITPLSAQRHISYMNRHLAPVELLWWRLKSRLIRLKGTTATSRGVAFEQSRKGASNGLRRLLHHVQFKLLVLLHPTSTSIADVPSSSSSAVHRLLLRSSTTTLSQSLAHPIHHGVQRNRVASQLPRITDLRIDEEVRKSAAAPIDA